MSKSGQIYSGSLSGKDAQAFELPQPFRPVKQTAGARSIAGSKNIPVLNEVFEPHSQLFPATTEN
jgi:hypothetical protein